MLFTLVEEKAKSPDVAELDNTVLIAFASIASPAKRIPARLSITKDVQKQKYSKIKNS